MSYTPPLVISKVPKNLGPKMSALLPRQQAFVIAMLENGGNRVRAALEAGYGESRTGEQSYSSAATAGWRLAHDDDIIAAMQEQTDRMLQSGSIKAAATLISLLDSNDVKVKSKVAQDILDRSGHGAITKQEISVTHEDKTTAELLAFIKTAAAEQGLDARKLIGQAGLDPAILDAEFEEVPKPTDEGLEDIL